MKQQLSAKVLKELSVNYLGIRSKAVDSALLNGLSNSDTSAGNTMAQRTPSGDLNVRLIRSEYADQSTISGAIAYRTNSSSDNYTRFCNNPNAVRDWLGAAAVHDHPYISTSASCNKNWNWEWGTGQPTHLWGSSGSSSDMYVFNPSILNVNWANTANVGTMLDTIGGSHYVIADRYDSWNTRLYMTYADKAGRNNNVHVYYADRSGNADKVRDRNIFCQQGTPSAQNNGDVWIYY